MYTVISESGYVNEVIEVVFSIWVGDRKGEIRPGYFIGSEVEHREIGISSIYGPCRPYFITVRNPNPSYKSKQRIVSFRNEFDGRRRPKEKGEFVRVRNQGRGFGTGEEGADTGVCVIGVDVFVLNFQHM